MFAGEGDVKIKDWGFEHYWQIIHNGYTKAHNGSIEDYVSAAWLVSYDFSNKVPWHTLMLKSGMLYSLWRDRALFDDFHFAASWYSELELGYRRLFMKSVFHLGEKQMLYLGDLFYRNTRQYSRTDLGIDLIKSHRARVRVLWSFHVANGDFENQQMLSVLFKV